MKVLLISAPETKITRSYMPPLGILYVAAALEKEKHEVAFIDAYPEGLGVNDVVDKVARLEPNVIGITSTTENRFQAIELCKYIKKLSKDILTVWGGPHASLTGEDILANVPEVDIVVVGEGEITILELLKNFRKKENLSEISGIIFRDNETIVRTNPRNFIQPLDDIPFPARHLLKKQYYHTVLEGEGKTETVGVISSRGCPQRCAFCANSALSMRHLRLRSPNNFVDEIEEINKQRGIRGFDFWDDTITINRKHIEGICYEIIKRKLDIVWYARARVNTVDVPLLTLMKKAGCVSIGFGIESGSDAVLKKIKKGISVKQAREAVKSAANIGLYVRCFFIVSLPGETFSDVEKTVNFMEELSNYNQNIQTTYAFAKIYPGTELETIALREAILSKDFSWSLYQELPKSRLFDSNPTIPLFENSSLSLEEIKSYILKRQYNKFQLIKKGIAKIKGIRRPSNLISSLNILKAIFSRKRRND